MSFLPQNTDLGELDIIEVYSYYNGPKLFSCRNVVGNIYFALWVDEEVDYELWLYVSISQQRFREIRSGSIDLRNAFIDAEDKFVFEVKIYFKDSDVSKSIASNEIDEDMLPLPNDYLKLPLKDFSGANLSRLNFNNTDLNGANLTKTNLNSANLSQTNLSNANLSEAELKDTNLSSTNLSSANLSFADLSYADLSNTNLSDADLNSAKLVATRLSGANLRGADLRNANLVFASLGYATLSDSDLSYTALNNAFLNGANLNGANLNGADLSGANLSDANLSDANLIGAKMTNANLSRIRVEGAIFGNNTDLPKETACELQKRGAIFNDSPGEPALQELH